jgi:hypothetical protein
MTLDDMTALLAGRLGQRSDINQMIYREIQQAQRALEKTPPYPWFLQAVATVDSDATTQILPDDFIELIEDIIYIRKPTNSTEYYNRSFLVYGAYLEHVTMEPGFGVPKNFYIIGSFVGMTPAPDQSYTFDIPYYKRDVPLTNGSSENLWSTKAEDLLVAEAGWHVARNIRDNEAATLFGQDRAEARRRIAQETTSRLESMRRAVIGSGEDALLGQVHWEAGHQ